MKNGDSKLPKAGLSALLLEERVKRANRDFYDIVGPDYETIDGRRSEGLTRYVRDTLKSLSRKTGGESILDLGCGSGFIARAAETIFRNRYAFDISRKIIAAIEDATIRKATADSDSIPVKSSNLDCVVTFSVLHHCLAFEKMLPEIHRILKSGGVYYSDHDMDSRFFSRFKPWLKLYRRTSNTKAAYLSKFTRLSEETYNCSEIHQDGIPSETVGALLRKVGFTEVRLEYHWFGLSPLTDRLFGGKTYKRGYAPLARIMAMK